jgi:hypothetical protein
MEIGEIRDVFFKLEGLKKLKSDLEKSELYKSGNSYYKLASDNLISLLSFAQKQVLDKLGRIYLYDQLYNKEDGLVVIWSRNFEFSTLEDRGYVDKSKEKEYQSCSRVYEITEEICQGLGLIYHYDSLDLLKDRKKKEEGESIKVTQYLQIPDLVLDRLTQEDDNTMMNTLTRVLKVNAG